MDIPDRAALANHPKLGASWEGLALEQLIRASGASDEEVFFWGVHNQAELDLLVFRGGQRLGYEVKYTDRPRLSKSQHLALEHLRLDRLTIVTPGAADYPLADRIHVRGLNSLIAKPLPI
jgi:predicted AAA+ superfamily ATPase